MWYTSGLHLNNKHTIAYMVALCQADRMLDGGYVEAIHHCQKQPYYQGLLEGKIAGALALEDDAGWTSSAWSASKSPC